MYNPYQMYQQPYAQFIGHNGMSGRYVNDFSEITANDVPMNGQGEVFVKNDLSEVQIRAWNANGNSPE